MAGNLTLVGGTKSAKAYFRQRYFEGSPGNVYPSEGRKWCWTAVAPHLFDDRKITQVPASSKTGYGSTKIGIYLRQCSLAPRSVRRYGIAGAIVQLPSSGQERLRQTGLSVHLGVCVC